jgi:hypothetical protein
MHEVERTAAYAASKARKRNPGATALDCAGAVTQAKDAGGKTRADFEVYARKIHSGQLDKLRLAPAERAEREKNFERMLAADPHMKQAKDGIDEKLALTDPARAFPSSVTYKGETYYRTHKYGTTIATGKPSAEYKASYIAKEGRFKGERIEGRVWMDIKGNVKPD